MAKSKNEIHASNPRTEVISFKLSKSDLAKMKDVVTRMQVTSGPSVTEPGAFTIRNHSFSVNEPGAFTIRNHNFSPTAPGAYTIRNHRFSTEDK